MRRIVLQLLGPECYQHYALPETDSVSDHLYLYLLGVGILTALTPWAIVGIIVLLGSRAGGRAAIAFAVGWFCAVAFIAAVVVAGVGNAGSSSKETTSNVVYAIELVLGLAFVAFAARKHARDRSLPEPPANRGGWRSSTGWDRSSLSPSGRS